MKPKSIEVDSVHVVSFIGLKKLEFALKVRGRDAPHKVSRAESCEIQAHAADKDHT